MEGWKDGRMEGLKDGRMEGLKNGRMETAGPKNRLIYLPFYKKSITFVPEFY